MPLQIRPAFAWFFQMIASLAWMTSVFIYDSWETGDGFQLTAAIAWTLSNLIAVPDLFQDDAPAPAAAAAAAEEVKGNNEPVTA